MIQEILTYLIVVIAAGALILKARKKFRRRNTKTAESVSKSSQHHCPDCSAECILRDASATFAQNNKELCRKTDNAASSD